MPDPARQPPARPDLSVIVPAYNEAERIGPTLAAIRDYAVSRQLRCELIVVDDGSGDGTARIVREFQAGPLTMRLLVNRSNRGKGYSVRRGMLAAGGELLLMCDADQSAPIGEFDKLRPWLEQGYDVAIGSRDLPDAVRDPPQPWLRRLLARAFRALRRRLLVPEVLDTQCGFKCFRREVARAVFGRQSINGWLFDCEVLALAQQLGYRIREVGIVWRHRGPTRVRLLPQALTALPTLLIIRRRLKRLGAPRS